MPILLLDSKAVNNLMKMADVMDAVESAFRMWGEGRASMPAKAYLQVEKGDFRAMPAVLPGCAGLKWVNAHPLNPRRNLPSVMAVIIYNDPETGYPLAIMDATKITAYRTGAASAIASKYLARQNSRTLGLIGAGYQAQTQILAHARLFNFSLINVCDVSNSAIQKLLKTFPELPFKVCSVKEAAASDIVCTLTPSRADARSAPTTSHCWRRILCTGTQPGTANKWAASIQRCCRSCAIIRGPATSASWTTPWSGP